MIKISQKKYVVFSRGLAKYLENNGNKLVKVQKTNKKEYAGNNVYIFEDTSKLQFDKKKYLSGRSVG